MPKKRKSASNLKGSTLKVRGRGKSAHAAAADSQFLTKLVLPAVIFGALLVGLGFLAVSAYRTATTSGFFGLKNVEVRGAERASADDIRRTVLASAEKTGVWNADIADIKAKVEKFPYVKSASVSVVLPSSIRVNVVERVPVALVQMSFGKYLVDGEGSMLAQPNPGNQDFPFVLQGWDEAKTEKAMPENLNRLKLYKKMLDESKEFDVAGRIKEVNLSNVREPVAMVEDSGRAIAVTLSRENIGKNLKTAIDVLQGKGAKVKSVDAEGVYPVLQYVEF